MNYNWLKFWQEPNNQPKKPKEFRILSIDGGGLRGIYAAYILQRIQHDLGINLLDSFDLITGTSTGSIIAAGITVGIDIDKIVGIYESQGHVIFGDKKLSLDGLYNSRYTKDKLTQILKENFGDRKMIEISKPLLIPATDIGNGNVFVMSSGYEGNPAILRSRNIDIVDAILASCSAPTFFDPQMIDENLLADGGLWANNPTSLAVNEAIGSFGVKPEDITVLSIGTGCGSSYYRLNKLDNKKWGFLTGWEGSKLIEFMINLQSRAVEYQIKNLLDPQKYLRINFVRHGMTEVDNPGNIKDLKSKANEDFWNNIGTIKKILE
jgi:uncharacterized protein